MFGDGIECFEEVMRVKVRRWGHRIAWEPLAMRQFTDISGPLG